MKKRTIKMPKRVKIKCYFCKKDFQLKIEKEMTLSSINCTKCDEKITAPITKCCVICAYSDKTCPYNIRKEALVKRLQIK